jgi:hypothetical protein
MAGATDKYSDIVVAFCSGETVVHIIHETQKCGFHDQRQRLEHIFVPFARLDVVLCRVALAYVTTSVDVYPEEATSFSEALSSFFCSGSPSLKSQASQDRPSWPQFLTSSLFIPLCSVFDFDANTDATLYLIRLQENDLKRLHKPLEARRKTLLPILCTKSDSVDEDSSSRWFMAPGRAFGRKFDERKGEDQ